MVNKENILKWAEDLESGKYPQAKGALNNEEGLCCLGVACEGAIENGVPVSVVRTQSGVFYDGDRQVLPESVQDWLGMDSADPIVEFVADDGTETWDSLAILNDDLGKTFPEIAAIIRENFLRD